MKPTRAEDRHWEWWQGRKVLENWVREVGAFEKRGVGLGFLSSHAFFRKVLTSRLTWIFLVAGCWRFNRVRNVRKVSNSSLRMWGSGCPESDGSWGFLRGFLLCFLSLVADWIRFVGSLWNCFRAEGSALSFEYLASQNLGPERLFGFRFCALGPRNQVEMRVWCFSFENLLFH